MSFICSECGETHDGLPTDSAFKLPDEVWAIPEPERSSKAKFTSDLCQLDERYFIRCLLEVPFTDQHGYYGWGAWAEVTLPVFMKYLDLYDKDGTGEPRLEGALANDLPTYGKTLGLPVLLQFQTPDRRPTLHFAADAQHPLAREAAQGISYARFHEILVARKWV
jgi:hypothetical protein